MADNNNEQQVERDDNILKLNLIMGLLSVPPYMCIIDEMTEDQAEITIVLFVLAIVNAMLATFIGSNIRSRGLLRAFQDAVWAAALFSSGGFLSFYFGRKIQSRMERIIGLVALTGSLLAFILGMDFHRKKQKNQQPKRWEFITLWIASVAGVSFPALLNDIVQRIRSAKKKAP